MGLSLRQEDQLCYYSSSQERDCGPELQVSTLGEGGLSSHFREDIWKEVFR